MSRPRLWTLLLTAVVLASLSNGQTISKPPTEAQKKKKEAKLRKELKSPYEKWLTEDVAYIITNEERAAFKRLSTDEEREQFVEQFWLRRDPTPDTEENEYKEEHYRRIAFANERFASGFPGWKMDRGRIYITYGPPDSITSQTAGGKYVRPAEEGGGTTQTYPFEQWRYRYIEGVGSDITIEFVDTTMTNEFHMTMDPSEKDALLYVPNAGLTESEQLGLTDKDHSRFFTRTDGTHLGAPIGGYTPASKDEFSRLEQFAKLQRPPLIKFKDLDAVVTSHVTYNSLPITVKADYIRVTNSTVLANVTLQVATKDLQFQSKSGMDKAVVNIYGRITTLSRRVANVFEDTLTLESPTSYMPAFRLLRRSSLYQKSVPLVPGVYRLNLVVKDVVGGTMNSYEMALNVPRYSEEKLASSSVILADLIEALPAKAIGTGQFAVGGDKVRPRLDSTFRYDEKMGIYLQLYNFSSSGTSHRPNATIQYQVVRNETKDKILDLTEDAATLPGASTEQVTISKLLPLHKLTPGEYTLKVKVTDKNNNEVLEPVAVFKVIYN